MTDMTAPSIDPGYGGYAATNRLLATASNSPETANQWAQTGILKQRLSQDQYQLATQKFDKLNSIVGSIITDPTMENANARLSDGVYAGVIDPKDYQRVQQELLATGGDPNKIRQIAFRHQQINASIQQQMEAGGMAAPQYVSNGQQQIPVTPRSGLDPAVVPAGGPRIQMYQDPNSLARPQDYSTADGRRYQGTQRQYQGAVGDSTGIMPPGGDPLTQAGGPGNKLGPYMAGSNTPASQGDAGNRLAPYMPPSNVPQPGDVLKHPPISGRGRRSPIVAGPGTSVPLPGGGTQNVDAQGNAIGPDGHRNTLPGLEAPAIGAADAAKVAGTASAEQGVSLQRAADGAPVRKAMLANLNDDLDKFTSGPGADWQQVGKAWANRNVLPQSMQFDPQSIASQEAFNKQATQLAQQQFQALGGTGTDSQLSSTFKANPNQALSQLGNRQIIQLLRGNEDALQAKAKAWTDWQQRNGAQTYGAFQQDFNKTYNPRVYQAMYMDPNQIADMRKNMSPAEQKQFAADYVALKNKGYITPGAARGQ